MIRNNTLKNPVKTGFFNLSLNGDDRNNTLQQQVLLDVEVVEEEPVPLQQVLVQQAHKQRVHVRGGIRHVHNNLHDDAFRDALRGVHHDVLCLRDAHHDQVHDSLHLR